MKRGMIFNALLAGWLMFAAGSADLGQVRAVYVLPMAHAFDQYLANQLSVQDVFEVVTDPQRADAILADEIGQRFEKQFEELFPPPPKEVKKEAADAESKDEAGALPTAELVGEVEPVPLSSFGRGRGNLFLVGRESRRVLWSTYYRPKNSSTKELNSAAQRIVGQLKEKLPVR
jgi:hypothetical protein